MPIYEYACEQCNHEFETLVHSGESVRCPECDSDRLVRRLSVPAAPATTPTGSLPMSCPPDLPPCGPGCCRL